MADSENAHVQSLQHEINQNLSGSSKDERFDDEHISGGSVSKIKDTSSKTDAIKLFVIMCSSVCASYRVLNN